MNTTVLLKAIYKLNARLSNHQWQFSQNRDKTSLQFVWKHSRPQIATAIVRKREMELEESGSLS